MNELVRYQYGSNTITIHEEDAIGGEDLADFPDLKAALSCFEELNVILSQYATEQDYFSKKLRKEGVSFLKFGAHKAEEMLSLFKKTVLGTVLSDTEKQKKIYQIIKQTIREVEKIKQLFSSFNQESGVFWLIDKSVVMDQSMIDDYAALSEQFSITVNAEPHPFANIVFAWLDRWPKQINTSIMPSLEVLPPNPFVRYKNYTDKIILTKEIMEKQKLLRIAKQENLELSNMVEFLADLNEEKLEEFDELLRKQEESHLLQIKECDRMLNELRNDQKTTVENCMETNSTTQEMLSRTRSELVSAYNDIRGLRSEVSHAWSVIQSCQNEINHLRNQDSGGCVIQ